MTSPLFSRTITVFALLLAVPVLVVLGSLLTPQPELWAHLLETVLADYVTNSLLLALGVGVLSAGIGTLMAWTVARYQFVGRTVVQWLLLLPMAIPAYIMAYSYTGLLDFAGPVQSQLRLWFDWSYGDYYFPEIRSLPGAILMLSLVLYPYVYMRARTAFAEQSASLFEASRKLYPQTLPQLQKGDQWITGGEAALSGDGRPEMIKTAAPDPEPC